MVKLSSIHPIFYHTRITQKKLFRHISNALSISQFAGEKSPHKLPCTSKKHQSLLYRRLGNSDPILQKNKVVNLSIASEAIDGILIYPNQIFSFWHLVGEPTSSKGYIEGMQLSRGEVKTGIGGGLCQLANLLYWMVLHTPLEVTERHHHSFDPFPDVHRTLPFGSGAGIFYNYVDLRFFNPTDLVFQIRVGLTDKHLKGGIYSNLEWNYSYHIFERNHQFLNQNGKNYRKNEIWRSVIDKRTGCNIQETKLIDNLAEVKYPLAEVMIGEG
jgi:vancomycin resistance protein VanW